jgi:hypothetical protein
MRNSRSFDGVRVLVAAAIMCIADRVLRVPAADIESDFCSHYDGRAEGPCLPFGVKLGAFSKESEVMKFNDPELALVRTMVLDYFAGQERLVPENHIIFQWECGHHVTNESKLFEQVCLEMGFPVIEEPGLYLSGEQP